jgi:hypothetical protein
MDRLITIKVEYYDRDTEVAITHAKSHLSREEAEVIVDIVRELRGLGVTKQGPSLRACIMIARVARQQGAYPRPGDSVFREICRDVLGGLTAKVTRDGTKGLQAAVDDAVAKRLKEASRRPKGDGALSAIGRPAVEKGM